MTIKFISDCNCLAYPWPHEFGLGDCEDKIENISDEGDDYSADHRADNPRKEHMKIVGRIILLEAISGKNRGAEALSYGHKGEPFPELLLRRGRATMFSTSMQANIALFKTLEEEAKNGKTWPSLFKFKFVAVEIEN